MTEPTGPEQRIDESRFGDRGQTIARCEYAGRSIVIKRYGRKRTRIRQGMVQLGHWTFARKSGTTIAARARTEREVAALWRRFGFDTFEILPDRADEAILMMEFVDGRSLYDILADTSTPDAEVESALRRFGSQWSRRHALAIEHREPRLLHEHGTFRHVWIGDGRQINFDFEICWTSRARIVELAGRETASFLRSLGRATADPEKFRVRLDVLARAYDNRDQVRALTQAVLAARRPLARVGYFAERLKKRREVYSPRRVLAAFAAASGA